MLNLVINVMYAYVTVKFIAVSNFPIYIVLFITTILELLIFLDVSYFRTITYLKSRLIYYCLIVFSIIVLFFIKQENIYIILSIYFVNYLLISLILLNYNAYVIENSRSIKTGVTDISLYSNLSKLIGFFAGSYIYYIDISDYFKILVCLFLFFSIFVINDYNQIKNNDYEKKFEFRGLQYKYIIVNTTLLSGTAVFFIPLFIKYLNESGLRNYASIVFVMPGVFTVFFLVFTKKYEINISKILRMYILSVTIFFYLIIYKKVFVLQVLFLSFIVALGIFISVRLRTFFIKENSQKERKNIIQIFRISSPLLTIIFSLIGFYIENIPYAILFLNLLSVVHILFMYKKRGVKF